MVVCLLRMTKVREWLVKPLSRILALNASGAKASVMLPLTVPTRP